MATFKKTKLSSTLLMSTAIVSVSIFGSLAANAAEYVVDTADEPMIYFGVGDNDGHTVTIETTGSIVDDEGIGFYADADNNSISLSGNGSIDASVEDGIFFEGNGNSGNSISLTGASSIYADGDGIDFRGDFNVGNTIGLSGNSYIEARDNGIEFDDNAEDTTITLSGNSYIDARDNGIEFADDAVGVTITLSGNSEIYGGDYGIIFEDTAQDVTINLKDSAVISADSDDGIYFYDDADGVTITLSDNSKVYGDDYGIFFYDAPQNITINLEDSAAIYADGDDGIYLGDDSDGVTINIAVNALIEADGYGIYFYDDSDNAIINLSGEIASGDIGIYFDSPDNGFELNIDGKIVSQTDDAIDLGSANDAELNLAAPAFIGGDFNLPSDAIVTIATGASHSVLWEFPQGNFDGEVPLGTVAWAYDDATNQFATVDPTAFSRSADQLADLGGLAFSAVRGVGQSSSNTWANVLSTSSTFETSGNLLESRGITSGVMTGRQMFSSGNLSVGVLLGGVASSFAAESIWSESYGNTASGFLGGVYGSMDAGGVSLGFALAGGSLAHTDTRYVNDNLADQGLDTASAAYNSTLMLAGVDISTSAFSFGQGWTVVPTAFANYSTQSVDGYTEEGGSDANAIVAGRTVSVAEYGFDVALSKTMGYGVLTATAGASSRNYMGDETVSVQLLDDVIDVQSGVIDAQVIGYVGANWTASLANAASINFGGSINLGEGMTGYSLSASVDFNF